MGTVAKRPNLTHFIFYNSFSKKARASLKILHFVHNLLILYICLYFTIKKTHGKDGHAMPNPQGTLTRGEQRTYDFLSHFIEENGFPPSVREIRDALGLASTSTVHFYLSRLAEKGYVEKESGKSRSLRLVAELPRDSVPLLGSVRAGIPNLAEEHLEGYVRYVDSDLYPAESLFALRIVGTSMIEAGILEDDVVIVCRDILPENGEIVVALLENEATVKTYYKENGQFRLQPENASMKPIFVKELTILGKVVACIRNY